MIAISLTPVRNFRINPVLAIAFALPVIGCVAAFPSSYVLTSNFLVGLVLMPFVFFVQGPARINIWYVLLAMGFAALSICYQLKIFYYIAIAFYILFIAELFIGRVNTLALFLMGVMSPVFLQIAVILGFPIRLKLSEWSGILMRVVGLDVKVAGNTMVLDGFSFTVDEACMGLHMLAISLLMGTFVIINSYRQQKRTLSFGILTLFFLIVFLLNILCNLFRIQLLVIFNLPPGDLMHEVVGILCLLVYVMIPLYYIGRWFTGRWGKTVVIQSTSKPVASLIKMTAVALGVLVMCVGFAIDPVRSDRHAKVEFREMSPELLDGGVTKFYDGNLLVYVKPIPEFFSGEHTPLICWKGSGYVFKKIKESEIAGCSILSGTLEKENEVLHTAWWYTDGKMNTVNQWEWRAKMFKTNGRFCLVNVTAPTEEELYRELELIFGARQLKLDVDP
jgi:exosortase N